MTATLKHARLFYGGPNGYDVHHDAMPKEFDFDHPLDCARLIFACMSNASGGHPLRNCVVAIDPERKTANLTANGAHAYYAPDHLSKLNLDEMLAAVHRTQRTKLGAVATDQYGNGHTRAQWDDSDAA